MIQRAPAFVLAAALLIALSLASAAWAQTLRWDIGGGREIVLLRSKN